MKTTVTAPMNEPARHTLEQSANRPEDGSEARWEAGLNFLPSGCTTPAVTAIACPPVGMSSPGNVCQPEVDYVPYMVELAFERPTGSFDDADLAMMADQALIWGRTAKMTDLLINGQTGSLNQSLALTAGLTTVTTAATKPAVALGLIQEVLADYGVGGTMYMSPIVAQLLPNLVEAEDDRLFTKVRHDMIVVDNVDNSAPNTVPGTKVASTATSRWIYAHIGLPDLRIGELTDTTVEIKRETDVWHARAWQPVAVTFDPCIRIAAEVSLA
jgi:hypothetical protein